MRGFCFASLRVSTSSTLSVELMRSVTKNSVTSSKIGSMLSLVTGVSLICLPLRRSTALGCMSPLMSTLGTSSLAWCSVSRTMPALVSGMGSSVPSGATSGFITG